MSIAEGQSPRPYLPESRAGDVRPQHIGLSLSGSTTIGQKIGQSQDVFKRHSPLRLQKRPREEPWLTTTESSTWARSSSA